MPSSPERIRVVLFLPPATHAKVKAIAERDGLSVTRVSYELVEIGLPTRARRLPLAPDGPQEAA